MRNTLSSFDPYAVNPYASRDAFAILADADDDAFLSYCERRDIDPDDPESRVWFDAYMSDLIDRRY